MVHSSSFSMKILWLFLYYSLTTSVSTNSRVRRIVSGRPVRPPPPPPVSDYTPPEIVEKEPIIFVERDRKSAEVIGIKNNDGIYSFLGIPFAVPPLGRSRLLKPRRLKLKGSIDAKKYGHSCPQWHQGKIVGNEDCLVLNVFTPKVPTNDSRTDTLFPVLMFIHGGNYKTGSASQYYPIDFVKRGIIVVTVQYRLGTLGYLNIRKSELSPNSGLFDVALAARWIFDYIQFFGGDPENISFGGQGSGSSIITTLVMNKLMRTKPKRIVTLSGTPISPFATDENSSTEKISLEDVCQNNDVLIYIRCLQDLPLERIMKLDSNIQEIRKSQTTAASRLGNLQTPGPVEEGINDNRGLPNFILESPLQSLSKGQFPEIPLFIGVTKEETGSGIKGNLFKELGDELLKSTKFVEQELFEELLLANKGFYINKTVNPLMGKLFKQEEYLGYFNKITHQAFSSLDKVIERTTDAFFNLPAYMLSKLWSQRSNVFLYSFEHVPKTSKAADFLNDIPLVSNDNPTDTNKGPSHGDDLAYLFDAQSLSGEPIFYADSELDEADKKVKNHYTTAITEFIKSGVPKTVGGDVWKPFDKNEMNYMIIQENPISSKGFRKCSMALWTGNSDLLSSLECNLNGATKIIEDSITSVKDKVLGRISDRIKQGEQNLFDRLKPLSLTTKKPLLNFGYINSQGNHRPNNTFSNWFNG